MAKKRIYYNEFQRTLSGEPLKPVYLFSGAESFLKEQAVIALVDKSLDPGERQMNLEYLYAGSDVSGRDVVERAATLPFLGNSRVLVIRQVEKWRQGDLEAVLEYVGRPCRTTILIMVSQEERLKTQGWKKIADQSYHVECYPLFDNQIPGWVERRVADHGKRIDREGLAMLIEKAGSQLGDLDNEITKLVNFTGSDAMITVDVVKAVAGDLKQDTTYELNAACGRKQLAKALRLSERVLEEGIAPLQLLGSLTWHFRNLFHLKQKLESGESPDKVLAGYRNPQAKKEMEIQLNAYRLEEYNRLFKSLLDLDIKAKSGYQHWLMALQLDMMQWCGKKNARI